MEAQPSFATYASFEGFEDLKRELGRIGASASDHVYEEDIFRSPLKPVLALLGYPGPKTDDGQPWYRGISIQTGKAEIAFLFPFSKHESAAVYTSGVTTPQEVVWWMHRIAELLGEKLRVQAEPPGRLLYFPGSAPAPHSGEE